MTAKRSNGFSLSDVTVVSGLFLVAIAIPVIIARLHCFRAAAINPSPFHLTIGILLVLPALFLCSFNLYTSFFRPWMFRRSHGDFDGYQHMSGAPILGSILIGIAAFFLPSSIGIGVALLTMYFLDPGGVHVAAFVILRECFAAPTKSSRPRPRE